jgi:hypothetical protein
MVVRDKTGMPTFHLAPTFDHASSLGRELSDEARRKRLTSRDERASVEAYAHRARSAFYGSGTTDKTMTNREVVAMLAQAFPIPTTFWAKGVDGVASSSLEGIFGSIPLEVISPHAAEFALRMLAYNQRMIREVALA